MSTVTVDAAYLASIEGALGALVRILRIARNVENIRRGMTYRRAAKLSVEASARRRQEPEWTHFERVNYIPPTPEQLDQIANVHGISREAVEQSLQNGTAYDIWTNSRYQVALHARAELVHLSIKRLDQEPIHDWRDLQRIKNELVGRRYEGVELYPAEERVVDSANQYHLWVCADPNFRFPFGFATGLRSNAGADAFHQRPFEKEAST